MKKMTRREFMVNSTIIAGGAAGCIALGNDLLSPTKALAGKIDFPETACGTENTNGRKVLIAYESYCGSTGAVAVAIGKILCNRGATVDVRLVGNIKEISSYNAVVIGSAVRGSSWWPKPIEFVKNNKNTLSRIPVAYFLTCLALYYDTDGSRKIVRSYMNPVLNTVPGVTPVDMGFFAGVLDYSKLNMMYRMVMKSKMKKQGVPEGDFRNWDKIHAWAEGLNTKLFNI